MNKVSYLSIILSFII